MKTLRACVAAGVLALAGCAATPAALYTLAPTPGTAQQAQARSVELRRIGLAGYLDRPDIVRQTADYRVRVADNDRWSEPLGRMIERVFTEDLVERLPRTAVFAEAGAISTTPDLVLEVDILRFDADADGTVVLLAQVAVRRDAGGASGGAAAAARTIRLTRRPADGGTTALVAALSGALGEFADRVADGIVAAR